ncbi:hypothetical protein JXA63_00430 [Candidatus Woesebacteria bacterium]|nr:hypothetical protein [Candidatus Woesebacteria bacterium]
MYQQILDNLLTKNDLETLQDEVSILETTNYKFGDDGLDEVLNKNVRFEVSEAIKNDLRGNDITISHYVKQLQKKLDDYQSIELVVPFEPTRKNMEKISDWIRNNVSDKIVINYRYNMYLIGGAVIEVAGEYRNFSLSKLVDDFFDEHTDKVEEIISK